MQTALVGRASAVFLEYDVQQHLKLLLALYGMWMAGGHHDGFSLMEEVFHAVDGDFSDAIQTGDKGIAARLVGADLFGFGKGKQGDAQRMVVCQRFGDHLSFLIGDLPLLGQYFRLADVFHFHIHGEASLPEFSFIRFWGTYSPSFQTRRI